MRRLSRTRPADEHGAVVVLVTLVVVSLFGMAALVLDVGQLLEERRELQNGADAAALAVAHGCAVTSTSCADVTTQTGQAAQAATYANGNTVDGTATVESVTFPAAGQVKVTTKTRTTGGGDQVRYFFGHVISPNTGKTVRASATAAWAAPKAVYTIRLTMSKCEWDSGTSNGTSFNTSLTGPISVVKFHTGAGSASPCTTSSGQDSSGGTSVPGGFGWLQGPACKATITAGDWILEDPGAAPPSDCSPSDLLNKLTLIPIYDNVNGLGGPSGKYHIIGFAAFHVTSFRLGNVATWTVNAPCSSPSFCIGGYFTRFVTTAEAVGGVDLGTTTIVLVK